MNTDQAPSKDIRDALSRLLSLAGISWDETISIDDWKTIAAIDDVTELLQDFYDGRRIGYCSPYVPGDSTGLEENEIPVCAKCGKSWLSHLSAARGAAELLVLRSEVERLKNMYEAI